MMVKRRLNVGVVVVLYNKTLCQSQTVNSLKRQLITNRNLDVVLWNNGPNEISSDDDIFNEGSVQLINSGKNKSLSEIYNWFLTEFEFDRYFIFDDDSKFDYDLFDMCNDFKFDLSLPQVIDENIIHYPVTYNGNLVIGDGNNKILSIGSGLCLSSDLVRKLEERYGSVFDERFSFYGVDTTFFFRVSKFNDLDIKIINKIHHSLSKNQSESKTVTNFRKSARAKDLALQTKYYKKIVSIKSSFGFILRSFMSYDFSHIGTYFRYLFSKR